jgi:CTP-dependent riboflavin kinase
MKQEPNYYGIIPAPVLFDDNISCRSKILYAHIITLTRKEGFCWAQNSYFEKVMKISQPTLNRAFAELENGGHITRQLIYKPESKEVDMRIIRITDSTYNQR